MFGYTLITGGGTIQSVATDAGAALAHNSTILEGRSSSRGINGKGVGRAPEGPSVHFEEVPENHDGATAFTVELHFSETPEGLSYLTVAPSGVGDVQIQLPARPCGKPNALCIGGWPLAQAAQATVPGAPLTASFSGVSAEHDGMSPFELEFRLNTAPAGLSYRTVQNGLFDVSGGTIGRAWRLQQGNSAGWGLRLEPSDPGDAERERERRPGTGESDRV